MKTQLLLHSSDVIKLLEANPEIMLGLQSQASEKVAEELKRKIADKLSKAEVDRLVAKAVAEATNAMKSSYSFPKEAKAIVRDIATEAVATALKERQAVMITSAQGRIDEMIAMATAGLERRDADRLKKFEAWAQTEVRKIAGEQFIAVMREAKEALS